MTVAPADEDVEDKEMHYLHTRRAGSGKVIQKTHTHMAPYHSTGTD